MGKRKRYIWATYWPAVCECSSTRPLPYMKCQMHIYSYLIEASVSPLNPQTPLGFYAKASAHAQH